MDKLVNFFLDWGFPAEVGLIAFVFAIVVIIIFISFYHIDFDVNASIVRNFEQNKRPFFTLCGLLALLLCSMVCMYACFHANTIRTTQEKRFLNLYNDSVKADEGERFSEGITEDSFLLKTPYQHFQTEER